MHILIIASQHFLTEKRPTSSIFQYEQAKALSNFGHQIGLISVGFISLRYLLSTYPYRKREKQKNLTIMRFYKRTVLIERFLSLDIKKKRYLALFKRLYIKYEQVHGRPEIVHAHNILYAGFLAEWLWDKYKIPYVVTEHSSTFARGLVPNKLDSKLKKVIDNAGVFSCVSSVFGKLLQNRFNCNVDILHNTVNENFFKGTIKLESNDSKFIFLSIASLDQNKNQSLLLRAFAMFFKDTPTELRIGGVGPLKNDLIRLAENLGITNQVLFLGHLTREEVGTEMRQANCFVLPSNYETFGVVLIEALANGLPLIATKSGGPEDIVNESNGLLVDVESVGQLANAMRFMKENSHKYDHKKLQTEARIRFGENTFVKTAEMLYYKAILNSRHE